jgi:hypothetical protein
MFIYSFILICSVVSFKDNVSLAMFCVEVAEIRVKPVGSCLSPECVSKTLKNLGCCYQCNLNLSYEERFDARQ